jgi:hypothetical protein
MIARDPLKPQPSEVLQSWQGCCKLLGAAGVCDSTLHDIKVPQACEGRQALHWDVTLPD